VRKVLFFSFLVFLFFLFLIPGWCQFGSGGQGGQAQYTMGVVLQASPTGLQIQDQMGMKVNIIISPQTMVFSFATPPGTLSQVTEIRPGDMVTVAGMPQGGGNFMAIMIGFLHQGEQINPAWQQAGGGVNPYGGGGASPYAGSPYGGGGASPYAGSPYGGGGTSPYAAGSTGSTGESQSPFSTPSEPGYSGGGTPGCATEGEGPFSSTSSSSPGPFTSAGSGIGGGNVMNDPQGHYSCVLPSGWMQAGKAPNGLDIYGKQTPDGGKAICCAVSVNLPPQQQAMDVMTIGQNMAQTSEANAKQNPAFDFKSLGVKATTVGGQSASCFSYTYKGLDGNYYYVEEYYMKVGTTGITLHLETYKNTQGAFSSDFQQIVKSFVVK